VNQAPPPRRLGGILEDEAVLRALRADDYWAVRSRLAWT
jgi:hypothetical protein